MEEKEMLQTLEDVLANRALITGKIEKVGYARNKLNDKRLFDSVEMDGVVVISDAIAVRYLEANYVFNTEIAPNRMPAMGLSIGDILQHENKEFLTIHFGVMMRNVFALHYARQYEKLLSEWQTKRVEIEKRVRTLVVAVKEKDKNCFGLDEIKNFKGLYTLLGFTAVEVPSRKLFGQLKELGRVLSSEEQGEVDPLAGVAKELAETIKPFTVLPEFLTKLREKVGHKGFPCVRESILVLDSPAASGGANMHTYHPSDNLLEILPSYNDLFLVACQAGNIGIEHMGAGSKPGEHYYMLPPKTPVFDKLQERLESDRALKAEWGKFANYNKVSPSRKEKDSLDWLELTEPIKKEVVKEVVPSLVTERVLGLHVDMNSRRRVALIRPVVGELHFEKYKQKVLENGLQVIYPPFSGFLADVGKGYGELPSVFGSQNLKK